MSSTITIAAVDNWAKAFIKQQPTSINAQEPALTTANIILQTMLSAPFRWRFNRSTFNFTCVPKNGSTPATYDYTIALADFGYLETQWIVDPTSSDVYPIEGHIALPRPTTVTPSRVTGIAAQADDDQGNITFRVKETPSKAYTIEGEYQRKAPPLASLAATFGPVPDEFAFVFHLGYLTLISLLVDDPRFPIYEKYFVSRLLALHGGLDEVSMNLFVGNWAALTSTVTTRQAKAQQAVAARGAQ